MLEIIKKVFFSAVLISTVPVVAQVEINGLIDVEVSQGGKDSDFSLNQIPADYKDAHIAINQMNLFVYSQISDAWSANVRLQFDTWQTGVLNPLRLSLAEIAWEPADGQVRLSAGRFVNPFGLFPQHQLSITNTFVNVPLVYGYGLNMSNQHGYLFNYDSTYTGGNNSQYGYGSGRLTTISYAGYVTGMQFSWLIVPEVLNLDLALTNVALTSQRNYTNLANMGVIARLAFQPAIFWQQGISFSTGSFMEAAEVNKDYNNLEDYKQTVFGTDWVISYTYFELSGEFVYAMWGVPGYDTAWFETDDYGNLKKFDLENYSYYIDLKYEPPFLTGSYFAVRYEEMIFVKYEQGGGGYSSSAPSVSFNWGQDVRQYTIGLGYKLSHNIQFKLAYSDLQPVNGGWSPEAYTLRSILSASF